MPQSKFLHTVNTMMFVDVCKCTHKGSATTRRHLFSTDQNIRVRGQKHLICLIHT